MRISTQELDDVLAAHEECNGNYHKLDPGEGPHCKRCGGKIWPCLTYRLARDLKAALKVAEATRGLTAHNVYEMAKHGISDPERWPCFFCGEPHWKGHLEDCPWWNAQEFLAAYDTEETQ